MGIGSFWHLIIILIVVLLVFGPGRLSKVMGDFGKGIRALREGLKTDEELQGKQITERKSDDQPSA